ncbi:MAG: hypothetical protein LBN07_04230 [Christensenellaceae bacterium]|nr:hypothetical protein [Christensenellaceae bacterium]
MKEEIFDIIGHMPQYAELKGLKKNQKLTHAYMLMSHDSLLLSEFAKLFAKLVMCEGSSAPCDKCVSCQKNNLGSHPDLCILPKEDKYSVSTVEWLSHNSNLVPLEGANKVYILDKFDTAGTAVQNKLLKLLETPLPSVTFILCVSNERTVLPTIHSRCKRIRLNQLSEGDIKKYLNKTVPNAKDIDTISKFCGGNLQRAIDFISVGYMQNYNLVLDTLSSLKSSGTMLLLSSKLNEKKEQIENIIEIFETVLREVILLRLNKKELMQSRDARIEEIAKMITAPMADLIIRRLYLIKRQLSLNCSPTGVIDNLLLYILEVEHT